VATTLASLGQRYSEPPGATFDERFGGWPGMEDVQRQDAVRRLIDEMYQRYVPQERDPGLGIDELGHRGVRDPSGYYMLRRTQGPNGLSPGMRMQLAGDVVPLPINPGVHAGLPTMAETFAGTRQGLPTILPKTERRLERATLPYGFNPGPRGY
jgi:hypothetical protein